MRDILHSALCVLMITATSCGGGDPPGGGNNGGTTDGGDTTDGTTGNGGRTDGHVPDPNNPLIAVIPGLWREVRINGQPADPPSEGTARVDAEDPDCTDALEDAPDEYKSVGPPGDACIYWHIGTPWWILDGSRVRHEDPVFRIAGDVLDNGWRIVITLTNTELDASAVIEYEKVE